MARTKSATKARPAPGPGKKAPPPRKVVDSLDLRLAAAQRGVLSAVVVLAAVAVWRPMPDPFILPKLTVVVLGAVALLAVAGIRAVRLGRAVLPVGAPVWIAAAFAAALVLATVTADNPVSSLVGQHGRYGGLLSYLAYLAVFFLTLRLHATDEPRGLMRAFCLALGAVSAYGLLQVAGLDPYTWSSASLAQDFSTMGNVNFAAGYVATVIPVVAALVVFPGWSPAWRLTGLVLVGASLLYLPGTGSSQGPIAAAAGLVVVGAAWLLARRRTRGSPLAIRGAARWVVALGGLLSIAAVAVLAVRVGPDVANGLGERRYFWQAALAIFADHPALGTGLDSFRDHFTRYRAPEHGVFIGFDGADSTHALPLGMLAAGGLPLALTYLAFVGYTGVMLVRALLAAAPQRLLPLAGFGGMWTAYQVQSLVSVDVPPLTLLHFVSAALVIAIARQATVTSVPLPFGPAARGALLPRSKGRARRLATVGLAAVLLLSASAAWLGSRPLRADLAAAGARDASDAAGRVIAFDKAVQLAPWEAEYRILQANARSRAGDQPGAYAAVVRAAELRSGSSRLALSVVDFAKRREDQAAAAFWIEQALRRDPNNPFLLEEVAVHVRERGDAQEADALVARAAALRTDHADY